MKKIFLICFAALSLIACGSDGGGGNNGGFGGGNPPAGGGGVPPTNNGEKINGMVNVSGTWTGTATIPSNGQTVTCDSMTISFSQSATELKLVSGQIVCNGQTSTFDPDTLSIQNGQLIANGSPTGTINGDTVAVQDGNDVLIMQKTGNKLSYAQSFTDENGQPGQLNANLTQ